MAKLGRLLILLILLLIATFAISLNLPIYYESNISRKEVEFDSTSLLPPIFWAQDKKPHIEDHIYSNNLALLTKITNSVIKQRHVAYKQKLAELDNCNAKIDDFKQQLLKNFSVKSTIDPEYLDKYFATAKIEQAINLLQHTTGDDTFSISEVSQDNVVQKLRERLALIKATYSQMQTLAPKGSTALRALLDEQTNLEQQIAQQIKIITQRLQNELSVNQQLKQQFIATIKNPPAQTTKNPKILDDLIIKVGEKINLLNQINVLKQQAEPTIIKHRLFERLCNYILVLLQLLTLFILYRLVDNSGKTKVEPTKIASNLTTKQEAEHDKIVAFFAEQAEIAAAKFIAELRKKSQHTKILLVDFAAQIISPDKNDTLGIKDVLAETVKLKEVIFTDKNYNVDILYSNAINIELTSNVIKILKELISYIEDNYDIIIYSVSQEPGIPIESFLTKDANINIISSVFNDYEAKNWFWILQHLNYNNIKFIDSKDL